jgi:protein-tyrosine-phosphatase
MHLPCHIYCLEVYKYVVVIPFVMEVLFVCTGNIFRSMSAEYCLKDYIVKNNIFGVKVASAGTAAIIEPMLSQVKNTLLSFGINPTKHKQRKLNSKYFDEYDLVVAMHKNHQKFIREHFGKEVPLFDEICYNKKVSVLDNNQLMPDWQDHADAVNKYVEYTVQFIHGSVPLFVKNMRKFV